MNRTLMFGIMTFVALVGISLVGEEKQAQAGHGCYGCYGVRYVQYAFPSCHGCYGCYGTWGRRYPVRRLLYGPRVYSNYRPGAYYGWRGWSGWRGWGGFYGPSGYYGPRYYYGLGGVYGGPGGYGWSGGQGVVGNAAGVPQVVPSVPSPPMMAPVADTEPAPSGEATLHVRVASDAKVFVNDHATTTPGSRRLYVSKGLEPGKQYRYELRAEIVRDGEKLSQTKFVNVEAGENVELTFDFGAARVAQTFAR